ncbi:hypothetical protein [Vibrio coralliirubri]|uniref:hypothetical protein n=1 Tax=Vibrio coralliirubri TaxID=1516159 RepID=UPI001E321AED|nr:hypothetical protein [Vibrio coralliirubri]
MNLIEKILRDTGPCLSSDLVKILVETYKLSQDAARKRVSRGCKDMHRLNGLPFPRNAKFVYLKKDYRSPFYWSALYRAFRETNSIYWSAIASLKARSGIAPYNHFLISCGSPLRQQKHIPPQKIIDRLEVHEIVSITLIEGIGKCVMLTEHEQELDYIVPDLKARLIAENILLNAVANWAKNLGLVSYNMIKTRDSKEQPIVSTTVWDLAGPSYLAPLIQHSKDDATKPKPGFFACDILLGNSLSPDGLQPFLRKCNTLKSLKNVGRCMPMFIAEDYYSEAFQQAKAVGIIPATPESLFGSDVAKGLRSLLLTLKDAAMAITIEPAKFNQLFESLGKIEGAAGNLRGALFEYFTASVVENTYNTDRTRLNFTCKTSDARKAESDVVAELRNGEILFIECKGHQPLGTVLHEEVERWLYHRVPTLRKYALEHTEWKSKKLSFALWTTGQFSEESLELLKTVSEQTRKYNLDYLDAVQIKEVVNNCNDKEILRTYLKYFYDHPLKKIEKWKL